MRQNKLNTLFFAVLFLILGAQATVEAFDFKEQLYGSPSTLSVNPLDIDIDTGVVLFNGADSQGPTTPFTWDWGDGTVETAWFPASHTYTDTTKNYIVKVTSYYSDGGTDTVESLARFVAPEITPDTLPSNLKVTIPDYDVSLSSRMPGYSPPATLTHFDDTYFGTVPRSTIEYVLTAAATIQNDFANNNVADVSGGFQQVLLRDPSFGGMYSLWYTDPVAFGAGDGALQGNIQYSSFFHEMGHNFTLNSPADFYYGGKIDGNANAIYSEAMAQIFQHATAYELINNAEFYGLSEDLVFDITSSAVSSMKVVRNAYEDYIDGGANFYSWNDPSTPQDETFDTFMTIAYMFFDQAENSDQGYRDSLKRMMELLQLFDEDLMIAYDQNNNNIEADTFRSTLMIAAMSYGFSTDLRSDFEALNFPIDDSIYSELVGMASVPVPGAFWLFGSGLIAIAGLKRKFKS